MASVKSVAVDNELAEKLKNARIRLGLTQEDVAIKANVSRLKYHSCLLYTSPSPRDAHESRMPSSA